MYKKKNRFNRKTKNSVIKKSSTKINNRLYKNTKKIMKKNNFEDF